jgi:hypothetical protein
LNIAARQTQTPTWKSQRGGKGSGQAFVIWGFHAVISNDGTMLLSILEHEINRLSALEKAD